MKTIVKPKLLILMLLGLTGSCRIPVSLGAHDGGTDAGDEVDPGGDAGSPDAGPITDGGTDAGQVDAGADAGADAGLITAWVPAFLKQRQYHAVAYDEARGRVVLFGGYGYSNEGALGDTWEWDGTSWTERTPAVSPPARAAHALAWDAVRKRVVLFGGVDPKTATPYSDTWEWDGANWLQRVTPVHPQPRSYHALAYDDARQRVVLFGGNPASARPPLSDTWEWDGTAWLERVPNVSPPARTSHALAYDAARQRVVLYGGTNNVGASLTDTWEWDGATWLAGAPSQSPGSGRGGQLTYDPVRARIVLVNNGARDVWEFDGMDWLQRTPLSAAPPSRANYAVIYASARAQVLVIAGIESTSRASVLSDTWAWAADAWVQLTAGPSPKPLFGLALAYDSARQRTVLFGENETWEWDGTSWLERTPAVSPPSRRNHAMAYDAARQRVVLFGGDAGGPPRLGETWEWDGATWLQRTPTVSPPGRAYHSLAYDSARQRVVLFGGGNIQSILADTWEWDGTTWVESTPAVSPPGRDSAVFAYDAARRVMVLFGGTGDLGMLSDTWESSALFRNDPPLLCRTGPGAEQRQRSGPRVSRRGRRSTKPPTAVRAIEGSLIARAVVRLVSRSHHEATGRRSSRCGTGGAAG